MKEYLKIADRFKKLLPAQDFIITGSLVFAVVGLIKKCGDLDIILVNPTPETMAILKAMSEKPAYKEVIPRKSFTIVYDDVKVHIFVQDTPVDFFVVYPQESRGIMDIYKLSTIPRILEEKKKSNTLKQLTQLKSLADSICSQDFYNQKLQEISKNHRYE